MSETCFNMVTIPFLLPTKIVNSIKPPKEECFPLPNSPVIIKSHFNKPFHFVVKAPFRNKRKGVFRIIRKSKGNRGTKF